MKFGGSSVATAERMREVLDIIRTFPEQLPCIVLSAMGKVGCGCEEPVPERCVGAVVWGAVSPGGRPQAAGVPPVLHRCCTAECDTCSGCHAQGRTHTAGTAVDRACAVQTTNLLLQCGQEARACLPGRERGRHVEMLEPLR